LEYRDGRVVALAVPSGNHEQIKANLVALLARGARDVGCRLLLAE
jgi:Uma2 family endonuclease